MRASGAKATPSQKLIVALIIFVVGYLIYTTFFVKDLAGEAEKNLAAQHIDLSVDGFFGEIKADHRDNVQYFMAAVPEARAGLQNSDGVSALMAAAETDDKSILAMLLDALPQNPQDAAQIINLQDNVKGRTALIIASEKGDVDVVNYLLAHGADTALADKDQQTPLIAAIKHKRSVLVPILIAADNQQHKGSSLNVEDASGETALASAIEAGDQQILDMLLAAKADVVAADQAGVTPLMVAAKMGDETTGAKLVAAGAKVDVADRFGNSPFTIAIRRSHPAFARFLLAKGANPNFHTIGPLPMQVALNTDPVDAPLLSYLFEHSQKSDIQDPSLLFDVIDHKNAEIAKKLLDAGVSVTAVNSKGETLLYHAIESGLDDIAIALIDKGADIRRTGIPGVTPLERAVKHNKSAIVEKLLSKGVPAEQKTAEGYTLAEVAVYRGYPEALDALLSKGVVLEKDFSVLWAIRDGGGKSVPVLLKYGAHSDIMSSHGEPALWLAAANGEIEAVTALIQYHANIDFPNRDQGMTPLAIASHDGQLAAVKLLVDAGAKLEAPDANGMTPLAHAAYLSKPDVVEYLISKGADINAKDVQGRSVMDLAALAPGSAERDTIVEMLQKQRAH